MRNYYLAAVTSFCFSGLFAQSSDVQKWTQSHPDVIFVESSDATPEYLENLEANNVQYVVYDHEISMLDIQDFEMQNKPVAIADLDETTAMEIKKWLAEHGSVKIIKRSIYNQMDSEKQDLYHTNGALILIGEEITLDDVNNY